MAWPYQYSGHTAAQFPMDIHGGGAISPYLLQPHNTIADAFKVLAPAIKDYLDKKKNDEIANQLMNMEQPPRAEAVDQYGASYDPALAKRQGLLSATEPRPTPAAHGGADAYKAQKLYQDYISKQQADQSQSTNDYWTNKVKEAQFNKYNADANAPDDRIEVILPDGRKAKVTPNEAAQYYRPRTGQQDSIEAIDRDALAWTGHHLSDLIHSTDARNNPDGSAVITLADGTTKVTVPADALRNFRDRYSRIQNPGARAFQNYQSQLPEPDLPAMTEPPPTTAPALPSTTGKQLDAATAKSILAEAGGNKEKARQIARERGYTF